MTAIWILTAIWVLALIIGIVLPYTLPKYKQLTKEQIRKIYAGLTVIALLSLFASLFVYLLWI